MPGIDIRATIFKNLFMGRSQAEVQVFRTLTAVLLAEENIVIGAWPKWLVNPKTGCRLELDLYLPNNKIAFEVQGPHHITDKNQIDRDDIKKYLCEKRSVKLFRIGILENDPYYFYRLFTKLNNDGYDLKLRDPSWKWSVRRSWGKKYAAQIKQNFGEFNPCYQNPDKYFEKDNKQFYLIKSGGRKEYL